MAEFLRYFILNRPKLVLHTTPECGHLSLRNGETLSRAIIPESDRAEAEHRACPDCSGGGR